MLTESYTINEPNKPRWSDIEYACYWKKVNSNRLPESNEFRTLVEKFENEQEITDEEKAEQFSRIKNNIYVGVLKFIINCRGPKRSNWIRTNVTGLTSAKITNLADWGLVEYDESRHYTVLEKGYAFYAYLLLEKFID